MDKIAILIPCYNEEKTIGKVVADFSRVLPEAVIYVYDNNSSDRTAQIAAAGGAVVRHEYAQGKGHVIRRMFREIDAQAYVMVDGDDTYPAESAYEMVRQVLEGKADMVVGDRLSSTYFEENKRPFHNFGNSLVRFTINQLFKSDIRDVMTGYRAFSTLFVKTYPVLAGGFEIETDMTVHAIYRRLLVTNHVITYRDRPEGSISKLNTGRDGLRVIFTIARLFKNYKPMAFFGIISLILLVISSLFIAPVLTEFWRTGLVPRFPTLISCLFVDVAALQLFVAGLILSTIQQKDQREFEEILVRTWHTYREPAREPEER